MENNENMREQAARSLLGRAELEVARHWAAEVEALSEVHAILLHERQCFGALVGQVREEVLIGKVLDFLTSNATVEIAPEAVVNS